MGADQAWLEGESAAKNGRLRADNPYQEGTEEYLSWNDGWSSVEK